MVLYATVISLLALLMFYVHLDGLKQNIISMLNSSNGGTTTITTIEQMFDKGWWEFLGLYIAIYFFFFVLCGVLLTHRIAGPIYHLIIHLKKCAQEKEFSPITFRSNDFFHELAQTYNDTVHQISTCDNETQAEDK